MAAERSENLKELVRRIIHNVNTTETGNGGANTQSASISVPNRANSTNEELNQRFMLPQSLPKSSGCLGDKTPLFEPVIFVSYSLSLLLWQ